MNARESEVGKSVEGDGSLEAAKGRCHQRKGLEAEESKVVRVWQDSSDVYYV